MTLIMLSVSLPVLADVVKTGNLHNLYETPCEVSSYNTNVTVTKPKRHIFRKPKKEELQFVPEVIVPAENSPFVVFPNYKK